MRIRVSRPRGQKPLTCSILGARAYDCEGPKAVDVLKRVDDELQNAEKNATVPTPVTVHNLMWVWGQNATVSTPVTVHNS